LLYELIRWFKFKRVIPIHDGLYSRHIHDDYSTCNYGNGNTSISNIQIPKTSVEVASRKFFSEQTRQNLAHFKLLNDRVFKPLLRYNESVRDKIFYGYDYYHWHSFKLGYNISNIESADVYETALNHIEIEIPSFTSNISQINSKIIELNKLIESTKTKIEDKARNDLKDFQLAENGEFVLAKLEEYWFGTILREYKVNGKWYRDIVNDIASIDDNKLIEKEGYLKYGANSLAAVPIDRKDFVQKFMDLVKNYEIWDYILDLVREREEIGDMINRLVREIDNKLVNEINNERYDTLLNCCPSMKTKINDS
jgi:hypothetical protein